MARTILIPIDFCVASLNTLKEALQEAGDEPVEVVLMHAEHPTGFIGELLFYSPEMIIHRKKTPPFREAMEVIENRYKAILTEMNIRLFHGWNRNAMRNFLDANRVDTIYLPRNYTLQLGRNAFDPLPLLRKSGYPICETRWEPEPAWSEQEQLMALFL